MRTLFVLMNHDILAQQYTMAQREFDIGNVTVLSNEGWSSIPSYVSSVIPYITQYQKRLREEANEGDYLLVQGDFGATYAMIRFAKILGIIPIYATTDRKATQVVENEKVITKREFVHVRFREYEECQ